MTCRAILDKSGTEAVRTREQNLLKLNSFNKELNKVEISAQMDLKEKDCPAFTPLFQSEV